MNDMTSASRASTLPQTALKYVENVSMFQAFEWYIPADHQHWNRLRKAIPQLKSIGIDNIWIPPGCKGGSGKTNGYDLYDLYDLGEFFQKGTRATKWGTKEELVSMAKAAKDNGMCIYLDAVLNHRAAADYVETCEAVMVDPKDRTKTLSLPQKVDVWTGYSFSGRKSTYSTMKYHWHHFSGTGYDQHTNTQGIYRFVGPNKPGWATDVSSELGNYDYLIFNDVDFSQVDVREDVFHWGEWIASQLPLAGMRFDAIKHYSASFLYDFIQHLDKAVGKKWFFVGEYWSNDLEVLTQTIQRFNGRISLFDVQLVYNFSAASQSRHYDLRTIFHGTLSKHHPRHAVTFVGNHDTQETQSLEAVVEPWFIPLAYALVLLRSESGYPCVWYGDLYGNLGPRPRWSACDGKLLPKLVLARKMYAYGAQHDYFDDAECVGWTRMGVTGGPQAAESGMAVVLNSGWSHSTKRVFVGEHHAGERWTDIMRWNWGEVDIRRDGYGVFPVGHRSFGVWLSKAAAGRERIDNLEFDDDIYEVEKAKLEALKALEGMSAIAKKHEVQIEPSYTPHD